MKKQTTVNFADIFHWAEKQKLADWNTCNDILFNGLLTYKGYNNIYLSDLESDLNDPTWPPRAKGKELERIKLGQKIIVGFMKEKKLKEMLVLND